MSSSSRPPRGWSKMGAHHYRLPYVPPAGACYYCGVAGCTECGPPPQMLTRGNLLRRKPRFEDEESDG